MNQTFVIMLRPCRPDLAATASPSERAMLGRHFEYLKDLLHAGRVVLGGPCTDGAFSIVILRASNLDEAAQLAGVDPGVRSGLFSHEVHPFQIIFTEGLASRMPGA